MRRHFALCFVVPLWLLDAHAEVPARAQARPAQPRLAPSTSPKPAASGTSAGTPSAGTASTPAPAAALRSGSSYNTVCRSKCNTQRKHCLAFCEDSNNAAWDCDLFCADLVEGCTSSCAPGDNVCRATCYEAGLVGCRECLSQHAGAAKGDCMSRCTNTATTCQASCPQCTLDSECAQGRACVNNVCVDAGPESQCNSDKDCASSKFCAYGLCWNKQCVSNQDCPPRTFECQVTPAMRVGAGAGRAPVSPSGSTLTGAPSGTSGTQPTPIKATAGTCRAIQ